MPHVARRDRHLDIGPFPQCGFLLPLRAVMGESGLQWDGGALCLDTPPERLPCGQQARGSSGSFLPNFANCDSVSP